MPVHCRLVALFSLVCLAAGAAQIIVDGTLVSGEYPELSTSGVMIIVDGVVQTNGGALPPDPEYEVSTLGMSSRWEMDPAKGTTNDTSLYLTNGFIIVGGSNSVLQSATIFPHWEFTGTERIRTGVKDGLFTGSVGTVGAWLLSEDTAALNNIFNFFNLSNPDSRLTIFLDWRASANQVLAVFKKSGVDQWSVTTPVGSLDKYAGAWFDFKLTQDGVDPHIILNGETQLLTFAASVDTGFWLDGQIGEATPIDRMQVGANQITTTANLFFDGLMQDVIAWPSVAQTLDESREYFTNTYVGHGMTVAIQNDPNYDSLVVAMPWEYDAAIDVGLHGNHGTVISPVWQEGIGNNTAPMGAYLFNGTTDYVDLTNSAIWLNDGNNWDRADGFAVGFWAKANSASGNADYMFTANPDGTNNNMFLSMRINDTTDGSLRVFMFAPAGGTFDEEVVIDDMLGWHYYVFTGRGESGGADNYGAVHVDGVVAVSNNYGASGIWDHTGGGNRMIFGMSRDLDANFGLAGKGDDIRVYATDLTAAEINGNYTNTVDAHTDTIAWDLIDPHFDALGFGWNHNYDDATDISGNGEHGIVTDQIHRVSDSDAWFDFTGVSSKSISTPSTDIGHAATSMVWSAWVKISTYSADFAGIFMQNGADYWAISTGFTTTRDSFYIRSFGNVVRTTASMGTNQWHHIVAQCAAGQDLELYVDGALDATIASSMVTANITDSWRLGWDDSSVNRVLPGSIDFPRLYPNRYFNATNIAAMYNATTNGHSN